jgi:phage terminase large subunit GpA-like protein
VLREAARAAAPPPDLDISQWAERDRLLGHSSRLSGPYRTIRTPYWREPMQALSPRSTVQRVVLMKGAQLGATELALNTIGFYLRHAPAPILYVGPTMLMAARFSRQRLSEMIALSPSLAELMTTPRGGERTNSMLMKSARNGALLLLTGANSASSLRALPIRVLILDEVDSYPGDVGSEGDPVDLAIARTESYQSQRKILCISTPTVRDASRIESLFQGTDKRRYHVKCPTCANAIVLEFEQLYLEGDRALYRCQVCGAGIEEREKLPMIEAGCWCPTASCSPETRGYALSQLYSPWTTWADLLARHAAAEGIPEKMQVFVNTGLGLTWGPPAAEIPDAQVLMARAEPYPEGVVPQGGAFLTAGADVQLDRIEVEVVAFGKDFESWSVGYWILYGDVAEPTVWSRLDELLSRSWPHVSGLPMRIQSTAIDAGFAPTEVTAFTRNRHGQRVYACKGVSNGWGRAIWPRRCSWDKNRHAIYLVSSDESKAWTAMRLRIDKPGPGFCHFPLARERGWFEQLTAEKLVVVKGQRRWVNPTRARNEATDARALAVCALHSRLLAGQDLNRWCDQFNTLLAPPTTPAPVNGPPPTTIRSRFVWG